MRLKSVKLTHFSGYRATTVIPIDEAMTGIVGRNDYGKSTILEALAIFFESGDVKADKSDMNCFSSARREGPYGAITRVDDLKANLAANCLPEDLAAYQSERFEAFLAERRRLMVQKIKQDYWGL